VKKTKRVITIIIILSVILTGCTLTPQVEFDNFVTDLDLISRFEEIAFNIEFGRNSETFQKGIRVLLQDLKSFEGSNEKSMNINGKFIKSAQAFLDASKYYFDDQNASGKESYQYGKNKYEEALLDFHAFVQ